MIRVSESTFILNTKDCIHEAFNTLTMTASGEKVPYWHIGFHIANPNALDTYPMVLIIDPQTQEEPTRVLGNTQQVVISGRVEAMHTSEFNITETPLESNSGNGAKNGYLSAKLHPVDAAIINDWIKATGITDAIDATELHATLFYAQSDIPQIEVQPDQVYLARVKSGIHRMGEAGSEWEALAIHLHGDELEARHEEIKDLTNGTHSYPDYQAHLSIKYRPVDGDIDLLESRPFPLESLRFTNESQEDIKS